MKRTFVEYHEKIRQIVPKERLLEFSVQDGYAPLCNFLGVATPKEIVHGKEVDASFPFINESATFDERMLVLVRRSKERIARKLLVFMVGVVGGVLVWKNFKEISSVFS